MKEIKVSNKSYKEGESFTIEEVNVVAVQKMYKTRPFYATPIWFKDKSKHLFGLVPVSKPLMDSSGFELSVNQNYVVNNNDKLKLRKNDKGEYFVDRDFLLYNLYLIQPEIAANFAEVQKGRHFFYLNNVEQAAVESVSKKKLVGKAYAKLAESSVKDWSDMLYFFGRNPLNYSSAVVENMVYTLADEKPQSIVDFFEKKEYSDRIVFVSKCLTHRLLTKDRNGYIQYDRTNVGAGDEEAANFLYDEKNDKIFSALRGALDAIEGHKN